MCKISSVNDNIFLTKRTKLAGNLKNIIMDDKTKTGKGDDSRINVNEAYEVQYWSEKFNVSADRLKEAVEEVGTQVSDVQQYLNGSR